MPVQFQTITGKVDPTVERLIRELVLNINRLEKTVQTQAQALTVLAPPQSAAVALNTVSTSGGGGSGGDGTPAGNPTELQFNDSGAFGGTTGVEYDSGAEALEFTGNLPGGSNPVTAAGGDDGFGSAALVLGSADGYIPIRAAHELAIQDPEDIHVFTEDAAGGGAGAAAVVEAPNGTTGGDITLTAGASPDTTQAGASMTLSGNRDDNAFGDLSATATAIELFASTLNVRLVAAAGAIRLDGATDGVILETNSLLFFETSRAVADLPASPSAGMVSFVNDATAPVIGAVVVGLGGAFALVWFNGTNWTVIGV